LHHTRACRSSGACLALDSKLEARGNSFAYLGGGSDLNIGELDSELEGCVPVLCACIGWKHSPLTRPEMRIGRLSRSSFSSHTTHRSPRPTNATLPSLSSCHRDERT
jgi:hypothetical protein